MELPTPVSKPRPPSTTTSTERLTDHQPSFRAQLITRRTYNRPLDDEGNVFETWEQTVDRVIHHQEWLWERAKGSLLNDAELRELGQLKQLMLDRKASVSGRTLWLGGTKVAKTREASQFNCAHTHIETVYDVVDMFWLLLQGCGVGFTPIRGTLNGFLKPIPNIEVIRSERTEKGGEEENREWIEDGIWTIQVGDSAAAWAKSLGKLLAGKHAVHTLRLDFSQIRPSGERLKGYGWICSGDEQIAHAYTKIAELMNRRAGSLLSAVDIMDICNHMGTVLSSRRSAEIALMPYGDPEWKDFALAKKNFWEHDNWHRQQSNNSLVFEHKPSYDELAEIFELMAEGGGSEPGFINGQAAKKRAPWFKGVNPCAEILLGNKGFCNLVEVDLGKFQGDTNGLRHAIWLAGRANYRQTCVDLRDGVLQEAWHLNNEFLRLCGVSLTGQVRRTGMSDYEKRELEREATMSAYSMADELGLQRPKNVTTVKPSGTLSKIMDTTEGAHRPLGRYVFNNVTFSKHDALVAKAKEAGYHVFEKPGEPESVLVTLPAYFPDVEFDRDDNGKPVNNESALSQLERYKSLQQHWTHQNTSITVYYSPEEVPGIIAWLLENWDYYVGVSFLYRADPSKTAADLGYPYLPQEVVTEETFWEYVHSLGDVELDAVNSLDGPVDDGCEMGVCPTR